MISVHLSDAPNMCLLLSSPDNWQLTLLYTPTANVLSWHQFTRDWMRKDSLIRTPNCLALQDMSPILLMYSSFPVVPLWMRWHDLTETHQLSWGEGVVHNDHICHSSRSLFSIFPFFYKANYIVSLSPPWAVKSHIIHLFSDLREVT